MGRQLDAAIAEALGHEVKWEFAEKKSYTGHKSDLSKVYKKKVGSGWFDVPYYSTDAEAMLELDSEMRERGWVIDECFCTKVVKEYQWYVCYQSFSEGMRFDGQANAEPFARALSAYKALTGKEWEGE